MVPFQVNNFRKFLNQQFRERMKLSRHIDSHIESHLDAVIRAFSHKLAQEFADNPSLQDEFSALLDDAKKKEKVKRSKKDVQEKSLVDQHDKEELEHMIEEDQPEPGEGHNEEERREEERREEERNTKKKRRIEALEQLSEMKRQVEEILKNCHEPECQCEECEISSSGSSEE